MPDGRERNTLASRLRLPLDSLEAEELGPAEPADAPTTAPAPTWAQWTEKEQRAQCC